MTGLVDRLRGAAATIARAALSGLAAAAAELPQNDKLWAYTIATDGSPYLTRVLLPRLFGHRLMLHRIHRADADCHLHNHPWRTATSLILVGGYIEDRLGSRGVERFGYWPGDVNRLNAGDWHRIDYVAPGTWTLFLIGERVQDWGFLVDGLTMPHKEYFARTGYVAKAGGLS